ncbi:MAG TPA: Flp pilus assembly protein CpaB [Gallionella sp.]|nr:Flp pilus assembly protein CpaB [Gallionella sp.]
MVLISLALGWYAWVLATRSMAEKPVEITAQKLSVVVAAKPIQAGVPIPPDAIRVESMTVRPDGAFDNIAAVEGKVPAENFVIGEPILAQRMFGVERGIASVIRPGERAIALKVDEVVGVGNRLNPHDVVDVFVTMRRNNDEIGETQSKLLLAGVTVLAVGNRTVQGRDVKQAEAVRPGGATEAPRTVVLAVPFTDVNRVALAGETGRVLLALRNPLDKMPPLAEPVPAAEEAGKVTLRQVATGGSIAPAVTKGKTGGARADTGVEVIRGLRRQQVGGSRME